MDNERLFNQIGRFNVSGKAVSLPIKRLVAVMVIETGFAHGNHFGLTHNLCNFLYSQVREFFILGAHGKGCINACVFSRKRSNCVKFRHFGGNDDRLRDLSFAHAFNNVLAVVVKLWHVNMAMRVKKHHFFQLKGADCSAPVRYVMFKRLTLARRFVKLFNFFSETLGDLTAAQFHRGR